MNKNVNNINKNNRTLQFVAEQWMSILLQQLEVKQQAENQSVQLKKLKNQKDN